MAIQFVESQYGNGSVSNDKLAGNIANAKLANSAVTIAGSSIALGASLAASTLAGSLALDDIGVPDAAVSLNSQKITSLATPTADSDAATKAYVDSVAQGLDIKDSVKAASTANLTLSGTQTVDGVALVADDRILVKDQSTGTENGIYLVKAGSWSRADDFATGEDEAGAFCFVEQGTISAENGFVCTNNKGDGVVGTDALTFSQFSGAGQIIAGDGLAKSGNTLSVNVDDSSIEISSDALRIKASGVSNAMLANDSMSIGGVTLTLGATDATPAFNLADATSYPTSSLVGTITNAQLAGSIANAKLVNDSMSIGGVTLTLGATDSTPAFDLADATNYPTSSLIGTITNAQLAGSIANSKLANSSVTIAGKSVALGASISLEALTLSGSSGLAISGSYDGSTARTIGVDLGTLSAAAIAPSTDSIAFIDVSGDSKKESVSDFMSAVAGDALVEASGVLGVNVDDSTIEVSSDAIGLKDAGVTQAKMKMRPYSEVQTADGSTAIFALTNAISDANLPVWKSGVQVFRNGQRLKILFAGSPSDASEYTVANNSGVTKVTLGGNPANGELLTFDYMTDAA